MVAGCSGDAAAGTRPGTQQERWLGGCSVRVGGSQTQRFPGFAIARREEATLRPRRPSGLAPQTRLRGSHALEETVVRPLRVLPLLLQRSVFPSFLFSGITRRPVCFLAETPFCSLS